MSSPATASPDTGPTCADVIGLVPRAHRVDRTGEGGEGARAAARSLATAVLDGADPAGIVTRLAELGGRPVALLDPRLQVLAWAAPAVLRLDSPPSLPPAALAAAAVRAAVDSLGPGRPTVLLPARGLTRRHLLAALRCGDELLGYLDVIEMGRPLGPADAPVAEQAAAVLSLQLLADARTARLAARTRDDALADLLHGTRAAPDARRLARRAGLDLDHPHLLVRLPVGAGRTAPGSRDAAVGAVSATGAVGAVAARGAAIPSLTEPDAVVVLVRLPADPGPAALDAVRTRLRSALDGIERATGVRRAVVSGICRDVADYPAALAETREVDGIAAALGSGTGVVPVTELATLRLVVNGDRADVAVQFAERCLGPLRRSDETTGGELVTTLRTYLACAAQVRATAKSLGVHENTVRYRLGRIEHVTGLDMRRFDALLAAQLAFQVERLSRPDTRPDTRSCGEDT